MSGNKSSYDYWSKKSTEEIIDSLKPGSVEPLMVKENGVIMQGNTRIMILQQRAIDVNSLPRVPAILNAIDSHLALVDLQTSSV